jgi:hypothetical protein
LKDYLYLGAILILVSAFGWYTVHERNIEHAKDVAAAAVAVRKDNALVATDESTAKTSEYQSAIIYKQAVSIPAVADLGVSCVRNRPAAGSVSLPTANAGTATPVGNATPNSAGGLTFDPTGGALTRGRDADAQIAYLQRRIVEIEKQMNDAP